MITKRAAADRGRTRTDWLDSRHTFSFGNYYDPSTPSFRALLVVNDDRVAAAGGFPTHGHADMEILSWVRRPARSSTETASGPGRSSAPATCSA